MKKTIRKIPAEFRFMLSFLILFFPAFLAAGEILLPVEVPNRSDMRAVVTLEKAGALEISPKGAESFRVYAAASGRVIRRSSRGITILHSAIPGETTYQNLTPLALSAGTSVSAGTQIGSAKGAISLSNSVLPAAKILKERIVYRKPSIAIINPCADKNHLTMVTPVEKIINNYVEASVTVVHYRDLAAVDLKRYDAIIITGQSTPWEEYDMHDFEGVRVVLDEGKLPVLGICGGHQLIAMMYGSKVDLVRPGAGCDKAKGYGGCFKVRGPVAVEILESNSIFYGQEKNRMLFASHCEEVKSLPGEFILTARSEYSPIYAMRHRSRPQYGVQFHPELGNLAGSGKIIEQFVFIAINGIDRD